MLASFSWYHCQIIYKIMWYLFWVTNLIPSVLWSMLSWSHVSWFCQNLFFFWYEEIYFSINRRLCQILNMSQIRVPQIYCLLPSHWKQKSICIHKNVLFPYWKQKWSTHSLRNRFQLCRVETAVGRDQALLSLLCSIQSVCRSRLCWEERRVYVHSAESQRSVTFYFRTKKWWKSEECGSMNHEDFELYFLIRSVYLITFHQGLPSRIQAIWRACLSTDAIYYKHHTALYLKMCKNKSTDFIIQSIYWVYDLGISETTATNHLLSINSSGFVFC